VNSGTTYQHQDELLLALADLWYKCEDTSERWRDEEFPPWIDVLSQTDECHLVAKKLTLQCIKFAKRKKTKFKEKSDLKEVLIAYLEVFLANDYVGLERDNTVQLGEWNRLLGEHVTSIENSVNTNIKFWK
jgi:hypothetical protein